jgi:lipopolysaccharide export system protein LptC
MTTRGRLLFDRAVAWSPVLLLGSLAALTYWLDAQVQAPAPRQDGTGRHDPDIFVENFRAVTFDAQGHARQSLTARRAEHFPDDESIAFESPSLALTTPGQPTITLVADTATLSGDREHIAFRGNVRAERATAPAGGQAAPPAGQAAPPAGPVTLTTEFLNVTPKTGRAETDQPVTIEEPRGIIHGVGMELDNQARTVKLKSRVRGTMYPDRHPQ